MEKRFLTYSKRAIRPNGGIDPSTKVLREEARHTSMLATSSSDLHHTDRLFREAESLDAKARQREAEMAKWLKDEELNRQENETKMLRRSLSVRLQGFHEEWAERRQVMEQDCARRLAAVEEYCEAQRHHLEKRLSKQRRKPVKYSPDVRDRMTQAKKLCSAQEFQQATYEMFLLKDPKTIDEEKWDQQLIHEQDVARKHLEQRIAQELRAAREIVTAVLSWRLITAQLLQLQWLVAEEVVDVESIRERFERDHAKAKQVVQRNCVNLSESLHLQPQIAFSQEIRLGKRDLEAAFKREWFAPSELSIAAKVSSRSRTKTCATFLGSRLQETVIGTYDLPSVSRIHFVNEKLDGTARDQTVVDKLDSSRRSPPAGPEREHRPRPEESPRGPALRLLPPPPPAPLPDRPRPVLTIVADVQTLGGGF